MYGVRVAGCNCERIMYINHRAHIIIVSVSNPAILSASPQSVPSPALRDSGDVSMSSELDRKSKPFRASSVSGSSLAGIGDKDEGFFLTICTDRRFWCDLMESFAGTQIQVLTAQTLTLIC